MLDQPTRTPGPVLRRRIKLALIPLLLVIGVGTFFLPIFHHASPVRAASCGTGIGICQWWQHLTGEKTINVRSDGSTLSYVQSQLDTLKSNGYHIINIDWPVQAGPTCIYGGFSASDFLHVEPSIGTDQDWLNLIAAAHSRGIAVDSWFNPSYFWTGSALFKQAEADVMTYGTTRANQPANSPARYFEWRSQTGDATKPSDTFCNSNSSAGSYYSNRWVTDPDAGSNVSYFGVWSDQPSGDYAAPEWQSQIKSYLNHWLDTGLDGFIFDAPPAYVNCDATCLSTTIVGTVNTYGPDRLAASETPRDATSISQNGFNATTDSTFWGSEAANNAISSHNPSSLESALSTRDSIVAAGGTDYSAPDFTQTSDAATHLLQAATIAASGNFLVIWDPGTGFGTLDSWAGEGTSFAKITSAVNNNPALQAQGARQQVATNNNNQLYAFTRTSPDGTQKALVVLNYQATQQDITVSLSGANVADGASTDLINGGAGPTISGGSFSVTLPAYGYGFYGVTISTCSTNLCGSESNPASSTNLTSEGTSDWAHWGANNSATQFDHKSSSSSQLSNYSLASGGTVNWYNNNSNSYSWSDGTPTSSVTNDTAGIWIYGVNNGFTITAPADTTTRTLHVYVGVWEAQGKLTATLSDGSATAYSDSSLNNSSGASTGEYTFTYKANSASQQLTITFVVQSQYDSGGYGNVTLQAATLS